MTQIDNWREKYLNALDEQERLEKLSAAQSDLLRRVVVNLSAAAAGLDPKLDDCLETLKDKLRGAKGSAVYDHMSLVEHTVKAFEVNRDSQLQVLAYAIREALGQLRALSIPELLIRQIEQWQRQLAKQAITFPELPRQLECLVSLQNQAITAAQQPAQTLWQRLRGGTQLYLAQYESAEVPSVSAATAGSEEASSGPHAPLAASKTVADIQDLAEPSWSAVNTEIKPILQEILDNLQENERRSESWQRAKLRIEQPMDWLQLVETLEDLRDLLGSRDRSIDLAISAYLSQVNQELHDICDRLGLGVLTQQKRDEAASVFGLTVTNQMAHIQSTLDNSQDLEGLKHDIRHQISVIHEALAEFREQQSQVRPLSDELQALIEKVRSIESESARTKQLLAEERHRANHDALTELPNRDAYNQRVKQEWQRFVRYGRPLSMAVCDIDHFKQLNDRYGHQIGDRVLRLVAKSLLKRLRTVDFVARYGGEEFVVLLPETSLDDAFKVLDSAREAIAQGAFRFKTHPVNITFSCGITEFRKEDDVDTAFARADKALYQAKDEGRNRTCQG